MKKLRKVKIKDVFGDSLKGYLKGDSSLYVIRRDDNYYEPLGDLGIYFTKYPKWQDFEKKILKYVQGRILDLGAGAGRHSLYFQNKDLEVHAIDISPGAVEVMRKRGIKNVYLMDLKKLDFPKNYFDSVLMMFNNFGLAGNIKGTKKLLKDLCRITAPKGRIIAISRNPYKTDKPEHLAYHRRNRKAGRPAGLIKIRIEYKGEIGNWFNLLMVSPQELKDLIRDTGWKILKIVEGKDGVYGVVLEKKKK